MNCQSIIATSRPPPSAATGEAGERKRHERCTRDSKGLRETGERFASGDVEHEQCTCWHRPCNADARDDLGDRQRCQRAALRGFADIGHGETLLGQERVNGVLEVSKRVVAEQHEMHAVERIEQ